jgi:hypothetical protein
VFAGEAVLENAQLRVEAFDYLQLPFVIKEGSIGRLRLQVCPASSTASGLAPCSDARKTQQLLASSAQLRLQSLLHHQLRPSCKVQQVQPGNERQYLIWWHAAGWCTPFFHLSCKQQ